ncbi:hypothetical protein [Paraburkholderia sp. UCT31]|nr:hypothetical protein [Paraburkholderia sp. UCT31]
MNRAYGLEPQKANTGYRLLLNLALGEIPLYTRGASIDDMSGLT